MVLELSAQAMPHLRPEHYFESSRSLPGRSLFSFFHLTAPKSAKYAVTDLKAGTLFVLSCSLLKAHRLRYPWSANPCTMALSALGTTFLGGVVSRMLPKTVTLKATFILFLTSDYLDLFEAP